MSDTGSYHLLISVTFYLELGGFCLAHSSLICSAVGECTLAGRVFSSNAKLPNHTIWRSLHHHVYHQAYQQHHQHQQHQYQESTKQQSKLTSDEINLGDHRQKWRGQTRKLFSLTAIAVFDNHTSAIADSHGWCFLLFRCLWAAFSMLFSRFVFFGFIL